MEVPDKTMSEKLFEFILNTPAGLDESEKVEMINLIQSSPALRKCLLAVLIEADDKFKQVGSGNLGDEVALSKLKGLQGEARGLSRAIGLITEIITEKEKDNG